MSGNIFKIVLPFLSAGLLIGASIKFSRNHPGSVRYTRLLSGALVIIMSFLIITGTTGNYNSLLISASAEETSKETSEETSEIKVESPEETTADAEAESEATDPLLAPDFTLEDQNGIEHTLSDYKGKVVFLNLWATWCPWCIKEMPEINEVFQELGENQEDVVILGLASTAHDTTDEKGIKDFIEEHGWKYPILIDLTGETFGTYIAEGYPTTWLIKKDGTVMGYLAGAMSKDQMLDLINQTLAASN